MCYDVIANFDDDDTQEQQNSKDCSVLVNNDEDVFDVAFHPVKPKLVCGLRNGLVREFCGHSHSSPFVDWSRKDLFWAKTSSHVTRLSWNVIK